MTHFLRNWRFWAGIVVSAVLLALLVVTVDRAELWQALSSANYLYLAPAVGLYFVGQWCRAKRWRYLLAPVAPVGTGRLFAVISIGYLANNVLPFRLGELVRALYLAQREKGVSAPASIATLSVERLYDGLTLLAFGVVTAPILLAAGLFSEANLTYRTSVILLTAGVVGSFALGLAALTALAVNRRAAEALLGLTRLLPARFHPLAATALQGFVEGLSTLNSPRKHAALFLLSLPVWLAEGGVYLIMAYSFNLDAHFPSFGLLVAAALLVMVTSNLITAIPGTVGGIGSFEAVATLTLIGMGFADAEQRAVATAYPIAVHLLALWLPVNIVGLALLLWHNVSLRGLTALPESRPTESRAPESRGPESGAAESRAPEARAPESYLPEPRPMLRNRAAPDE